MMTLQRGVVVIIEIQLSKADCLIRAVCQGKLVQNSFSKL